MFETIGHFLEQTPMLALFGAIGIGYAVGRISIGGFSLGIGAVLFAGLRGAGLTWNVLGAAGVLCAQVMLAVLR